jgi:general secretion pathway protein D
MNANFLLTSPGARAAPWPHLPRGLVRPVLGFLALIAVLGLVACANPAFRDAESLSQAGQHEAALNRLQQAADKAPQDAKLLQATIKQRETTVAYLLYQADLARAGNDLEGMKSALKRLEASAPKHARTQWLRQDIDRRQRVSRLMAEAKAAQDKQDWARAETALRATLAEDPSHTLARQQLAQVDEARLAQTRQQSNVQLKAAEKPITLEFREASVRTVFEALARAADVNFVFDKDVRGDAKVTLFLRNTTVDEAMRVILNTQQLGAKLLNENTVLVFPNTAQKQRDLLDTVTRNFYLVNADPKQVQSLVRTVAKSRDIFVDERLNMLVVRDTPEVIRLVERLVASMDLPDPEVMLELEVMEVSSSRVMDLGLTLPTEVNYGIPNSTAMITTASGLRASIANPLAIAKLRSSVDASNILANPKIRARNRDKAKILLGEKVPVFTTTSTANVGVSSSVNYLDVGLKLELEPVVQLDDEVVIKVALEVSSLTGLIKGPQDSSAYQIGTRQATTSLRLRDGETQILAGLINDTESKSGIGIPYLNEAPLLGRLFGSRNDTHKKTEVVLLITPRVVRNLNSSALPVSSMSSGTEAQPGAAPWVLRKGQVSTNAGAGRSEASERRAARGGRPGAAGSQGDLLSGPEQIMPNSSFQVTVRNPGDAAMQASLLYDPGVLSIAGGRDSSGQHSMSVPAQGTQTLTFAVKAGASGSQTTVTLDGGNVLVIQIADPNAAVQSTEPAGGEPEAAQAPDVPTDSNTFH